MYKVLFFDNDFIIRLGLHQILLEHLPGNVLFNTVSGSTECQEWLAKNRCDLVIIGSIKTDINQLINQIKVHDIQTRILIFADMKYSDALNVLVTGANGFIYQRTEISEIALAVHTVLSGTDYWGRQLTEEMAVETLLLHFNRKKAVFFNKREITNHKLLSKRQMDVIRALILGESVQMIAVNLGLSPSTVATHKSIAFKKLGINSLVQLVDSFHAGTNYLNPQSS